MTYLRLNFIASAVLSTVCFTTFLFVSAALAQPPIAQTAPDNSGQNKNQGITAENQANTKADRVTTANIRKAIIADKNLSTYAHNIKVITVNGAVTLKGPVKSEEEKAQVASDAAGVVSADKITNNLTVKQ
jgi:hyperosmotically inducible periplasmic protein